MSKIVGIGANVYDTLINLSNYPNEDTKLKADGVTVSGGGPCATGLVVAAKLGAECSYIGNFSDDDGGKFLKSDMEKYKISTEFSEVKCGYSSFLSYIWLSKKNASRTCVFYKGNLPPLALSEKQKDAIKNADILMIDGNELSAAKEACVIAKKHGTKILYDAGGLYDGIEDLLSYADYLIPSHEFALSITNEKSNEKAVISLFEKYNPEVVVVTCGKTGGIMYDGKNITSYPAFSVDAVDTNGSGDVFHGAFAFCVGEGYNYNKACIVSSAASAIKCTKTGARLGAPTFEEVKNFLKERGENGLL